MDVRVRCLALYEQKLVMIHRISPKRPEGYFVFPGGGVDAGETPEHACVREMLEETSLQVEPVKMLGIQFHQDRNGGHCQLYYLVNIVGGILGPGTGFEYTPEYAQVGGTHDPITVAPDALQNLNQILPEGIREIIAQHTADIAKIPFFTIDNLC